LIRSFRDIDTERVFKQQFVKRFQAIAKTALRRLIQIHSATSLNDLAVIPGNHLEFLAGDRKGQHSIRINDQYRICFVWKGEDAFIVEITDYH
jgi:toxin HigB-1